MTSEIRCRRHHGSLFGNRFPVKLERHLTGRAAVATSPFLRPRSMTMLRRKLIRDLRRHKGQMSAIVLVLACGIATLAMSLGTMSGLRRATDDLYGDYGLADVFVGVSQVPSALARELRDLPGIESLQMRIVADVRVQVTGLADQATARLIGIAPVSDPRLNRLVLREGRHPDAARRGEILAGEAFFKANRLQLGDALQAVVYGRRLDLTIVGVVISPEYVFTIRDGAGIPDNRRYGALWMNYDELASAVGMPNACNDLAFLLDPTASTAEVIAALDRKLQPYGGRGAYGRGDLISYRYTSEAITQLASMAVFSPVFFFAVAAFLVHMALSRLIDTQREQIATLRAFGFTRREISAHYLQLVLLLATGGSVVGIGVGYYLAQLAVESYRELYRVPNLQSQIGWELITTAAIAALAACGLGAIQAVRRAVNLPPAVGMRPEPPVRYRHAAWWDALAVHFAQTTRMILRHLHRRPWRAAFACLGIALAVAVMVLGCFVQDAIEYIIDYEFQRARHQQVTVFFQSPQPAAARYHVQRWPGVLECELFHAAAVRIGDEHRRRTVTLTGLSPTAGLFRPRNSKDAPIELGDGIALSESLAAALNVNLGSCVRVESLAGQRRVFQAIVTALVTDFSGLNAYMSADVLGRQLQERDSHSGALLTCDERQLDALYDALRATPQVTTFNVTRATLDNFWSGARNLLLMRAFNIGFAVVIAVGVVYNTARISLAERLRELATLRVLGFTRGEVSYVLVGELALLTLAALPIGMTLGKWFARLFVDAVSTETQRLPLVISSSTYGWAALIVLTTALFSAWIVRRYVSHLSLMEILRAKD